MLLDRRILRSVPLERVVKCTFHPWKLIYLCLQEEVCLVCLNSGFTKFDLDHLPPFLPEEHVLMSLGTNGVWLLLGEARL